MKKTFSLVVLSLLSFTVFAADCTKEQAKEAVEKICAEISAKGDGAMALMDSHRFCGDNYVWVQDSDVKMIHHPIKPNLDGKDLTKIPDDKGKFLFIDFDKVAKGSAAGGWVDYVWKKPGAEVATDKVSFVKLCPGDKKWIAGSGVWK